MPFASVADFLAMGGHAPYVWSAWGVTLFFLLASVWHARLERRQLIKGLKRRERREQAHRAPHQDNAAGGGGHHDA
ncbi:MAG: heme exporter protein CcmD [Halomonas sp.]|nr:heme exporter protein CcmD [Halomonas sp.]MDN6298165.1 heme exporter protein CcmD [Halomonas sp.]MDN6314625.1 heme exporter protein CcmD [Halomonas sp.]MDN6335749.1 heme exporter protein CcmD [Halomonas sp.]